jgi:regulator of sigma E protease
MNFLEIVVMVAQLLLGISILVGLHELGHLLAAKMFGMRVEKYSIGFPPKIVGFKYGETEYSIGAIPLGGFVKISGMIDESMDTEYLNKEPEPWEFRAKPAWQRLIVMMGGIIVNVITGIFVFIFMTFFYGEPYYAKNDVNKYGVVPTEFGKELGFKEGDKILKVNGHNYSKFSDLFAADVILENNSYYTVQRNDETQTIKLPVGFVDRFSDKETGGQFLYPRTKFRVKSTLEKSGAEKAGLKNGDSILALNNIPITYYHQFTINVQKNKNKVVTLLIKRRNEKLLVKAEVNEEGIIGIRPETDVKPSIQTFTLAESIPHGTKKAFGVVWVNMKAFGKIFKREISASKSLSGPVGIAELFGGTWDWQNFWGIVGLLSMVLAFMNFLPIPALDGGHVMFLLYEIISGRKPSDKFLENATKVGMVLLLGLMIFAFGNDIYKKVFPASKKTVENVE